MPKTSPIDSKSPLRHAEERAIGVAVPRPLSERLDLLVEVLEDAGHRAYRKDLVAALILEAPESASELEGLLRRYRTAKAGAAAIGPASRDRVLGGRPASPGRRPRRSA